MIDEALAAAVARLDDAVGRLERSARSRESSGRGVAEAYALLEERHGLLRLRIQETIERLDGMIAGAETPR